jgi:catechol 2,3-dioxygenase-like lactoylglutathione lyase family enzyme
MTVEFNHTIVLSHDKKASAEFLAGILGITVEPAWGPFVPVPLGNGVTLEYLDAGDRPIQSQHYSFLVSDDEFDTALARIRGARLDHWADPFHAEPGRISHNYGGRGVHFQDPDGHDMELQTTPYGEVPAY